MAAPELHEPPAKKSKVSEKEVDVISLIDSEPSSPSPATQHNSLKPSPGKPAASDRVLHSAVDILLSGGEESDHHHQATTSAEMKRSQKQKNVHGTASLAEELARGSQDLADTHSRPVQISTDKRTHAEDDEKRVRLEGTEKVPKSKLEASSSGRKHKGCVKGEEEGKEDDASLPVLELSKGTSHGAPALKWNLPDGDNRPELVRSIKGFALYARKKLSNKPPPAPPTAGWLSVGDPGALDMPVKCTFKWLRAGLAYHFAVRYFLNNGRRSRFSNIISLP